MCPLPGPAWFRGPALVLSQPSSTTRERDPVQQDCYPVSGRARAREIRFNLPHPPPRIRLSARIAMESTYGVGINNRYALFLDEEGEESEQALLEASLAAQKIVDNNLKAQAAAAAVPVVTKGPKDAKPAATTDPKKAPAHMNPKNNNLNHRRDDKENRRFEGKRVLDARKAPDAPRENNEERTNRRNNRDAPDGERRNQFDGERRGPYDSSEGGRGRGRGSRGAPGTGRGMERGGPRGNGGGRGGPGGRGGKRDFDRKSGDDRTSGVKHVDKREGGGSHNWGTFEDEIKAVDDKNNVSTEENPAEAGVERSGDDNAEDQIPREEEPKTMTLDEWRASQDAKKNAPRFNLRKAGEGAAATEANWKKTYAYKKEKESAMDDEDEEDQELYPQRVNRQRRVLDIEFNFTTEQGSRGGPG
eukprot:maker-scaffold1628_size33005-snap-gene-0.7 protein:Tk10478 transcript:maker-scaffold1628_size33005-snap-gene-0.7-mRNA-1 annotation:"vasa intronic gene"